MTRTLTILAVVAAALAVWAAPAPAASTDPLPPSSKSNVGNIDLRVGVKDGTSNTMQFAERRASLTIDLSNTMSSGYVVQSPMSSGGKPRQGLILYDGHAGLGTNADAAIGTEPGRRQQGVILADQNYRGLLPRRGRM